MGNVKIGLVALIATLTLVLFTASATVASAATIYVPDDCKTIQEAVNSANSGDTIIVKDGTYTENINVNKMRLTIRSENGAAKTIVQAANSRKNVFDVCADCVNISGFTAMGATGCWNAGIWLRNVNHCRVFDNFIRGNSLGISLFDSNGNSIKYNDCLKNDENGIVAIASSNNILANNICNFSDKSGIWLGESSDNNTIVNNSCNFNKVDGVGLSDSSNNNTLIDNNCSNNEYGISIFTSSDNTLANNICNFNSESGICFMESSDNNTLTNNTCVFNKEDGITLCYSNINNILIRNNCSNNKYGITIFLSCNGNILTENTFSKNEYGILITRSDSNIIYLNNFVKNNVIDVISDFSTNVWSSISKVTYKDNYTNNLGNYWDDHEGIDANNDCIGDSPYDTGENMDNYPLMLPFENYPPPELPTPPTSKKEPGFEVVFAIIGLLTVSSFLIKRG